MKRYILILSLIIAIQLNTSFAQQHIFIGIQPAITVEPFYEKGELDVNIFPLVAELTLTKRIDLRLTPMLNYHFGGEETGLSDVGSFIVLPIFFKKRETLDQKPYGFFIAPVLGIGRNLLNEHLTTTLALEPGYMLRADKRFTVSVGCQFGASHFNYDDLPNTWTSHFGPKISLGFWI